LPAKQRRRFATCVPRRGLRLLRTLARRQGRGVAPGSTYHWEAVSVAGFIQQLAVSYVGSGYWFYVTGRIPEGKARQVGAVQPGEGEVGALEVGIRQVGPVEVGAVEVGVPQVGPAQVRPPEHGAVQLRAGEIRPAEVGAAEAGPGQAAALEA